MRKVILGLKGDTGFGLTGATGVPGHTRYKGDTGTKGDTGSGLTGATGVQDLKVSRLLQG